MEIGIIEDAIALILKLMKHILTFNKKSTIYSWNLYSLKSECFGTFSDGSNQGAV